MLSRGKKIHKLSENKIEKLINIHKNEPELTNKILAKRFGISETTVKKYIGLRKKK